MKQSKYVAQISLPFLSNIPKDPAMAVLEKEIFATESPRPRYQTPAAVPQVSRFLAQEDPEGEIPDQEREFRDKWTRDGVPAARQEAILKELEEKAKPGAQIGPWKLK